MRYGLRTLFAAITAICCLLGYCCFGLSWARARQEFRDTHRYVTFESANRHRPARHESYLLTILGEPSVATIYVTVPTIEVLADGSEVTVHDRAGTVPRLKRLFPEAEVVAFPYRVRRPADTK